MKRDLSLLDRQEFDLVVVGGGIFGACAAWDASLRGLSVALIERSDFGAATSANSLKMVHGGIRYLQHLDFFRIRQSSAERTAFLRMAPHLVRPLPIVVPTFGYLHKSKPFLRAGMALYDLVTADRNRTTRDPDRRVPWTRGLSRSAVLDLFPGLPSEGLTGAAVFHDGQMYNPPRLVWAVVRSALEHGAVAANYLEATDLLRDGKSIIGVKARDCLEGGMLEIRSKVVLNATGPYAESFLERVLGRPEEPKGSFSRDACFVVKRLFDSPFALAIPGATSDPDAKLSRGRRHLFLCPWREYTLIGVWHKVFGGDPDAFRVTTGELGSYIAEVSRSYPSLGLTADDVTMVNSGLVPFGENPEGATNLRYGHRSRLIDHAQTEGLQGLLSLIGVRYTTGRYEASRAVDLVMERLDKDAVPSKTASVTVYGGDILNMDDHVKNTLNRQDLGLSRATLKSLAYNYGSKVSEVLDLCGEETGLACEFGDSTVVGVQVLHAVREEMAVKLSDVILRRTGLGTGQILEEDVVRQCAVLMGGELGWSPERVESEVASTTSEPAFWTRHVEPSFHSSDRRGCDPEPAQ